MINGGPTEKSFNERNLYGYGFNNAKLMEKELSNSVGKGGLNNVNLIGASIINDNPRTNVYEATNLAGYGDGSIKKTNYEPTIIDKLQYIQPTKQGFTNNRNLKILESIEQSRQPLAKHNVIGAKPSLVIDY